MTATVLLAAASVVVGVDNSMSPEVMTRRVREARAAHPGARIEVAVADGVYAFSKPLVLGPGDSGEENAPVVWKAKGRAVFCGGAPLQGWRDDGGGVWSCPAPRNSEGKLVWFNSLYANGRRADCARFPNRRPLAEEYLTPTDFRHVPPEGFVRGTSDDWGPGDEYFSFGKPFHEFDNLEEGELNHIVVKGCDAWTFSSHELLGYDEKKGEFHTYVQGRIFSCYWTGWNRALVWFENVRAGFDQPGEWFYDWTAGRIRYRPLVGEKIESLEALVPSAQLVSVMEIRGEPEKGAFVHDVEFEGLTFSCSMADGYLTLSGIRRQFPLQSAVGSGGAVYMRGAKRVTLRRCRVEHTENYGFRIDEGSQHCSILDCELTDLGAGGVFAGNTKLNQLAQPGDVNPEFRPGHAANIRPGYVYDKIDNLSVAFITIDNCLVSGGGRFNPEGSGILLTNVSDSKVVHNEIEDMYYTGVSVGWTWGYSRSVAQRNTIAFNRIHDFGKHVMADMGGVYTLGTSFGTAITNNVIYNVDSFSYGGWGLYNDEGSEGILWENNLVYDTTSSSYHLHYGRGNTVRNNILAFGREARIIISASNVEGGVDFERNIIVWDDTADASENRTLRFDDIYGGGDPGVTFKDNLFWNLTGETKLGDRAKGLVADPLFEDALKRDFRLKAGSPAVERLGFVPFDFSKAGRRPAKPASAPISQAGESSADVVRLKDAYAGRFLVGTCINRSQTARIQPEEDRLISATFNCATPENEMKPAAVQPEEGRWDFSAADAFVDYAQKRGMTVIGHCLVWHNTVGDWMFKGPDGKEASRDLLIERMRTHIHKVVSRYKGRVKGWDVVNEALEWDGSFYKPSKWYQIIGEDYVDLAFRFAHEADPDAELYYNDWDLARRSKADGALRLVRRLKAKGLRIDAVGMQSHVSLTYPDLREYEKSMDDFIAAGVNVMVTELDVSVLPAAWNLSAEITARHDYEEKYDPYRSGLPAAKQQELADRYAALFRIFLRHAGKLTRVSFWGAHDGCSWLNDFPVAGRTDYPLLYDRSFKPKPCAFAVEKLARSAVTDDYLRPVRPVGVNGQPAWNDRSVFFMYPPAFGFTNLAGAVRYRFTVKDETSAVRTFVAESPNESLASVWANLPRSGWVDVLCEALDAQGATLAPVGSRSFWKQAPYTPGAYPVPARSPTEAARLITRHVRNLPIVRANYLSGRRVPNEMVDAGNQVFVSYPAKMGAAVLSAMARLSDGESDEAKDARRLADGVFAKLQSLTEPEGRPLAGFPRTYETHPALSGHPLDMVTRNGGKVMMIYPREVADAYLDFHEVTRSPVHLAAAVRIADRYIALQGEDGTWPLNVWIEDGKAVEANRLVPAGMLDFFERVYALTGEAKYRIAADRAFVYVERGPLATWNWEGQFEDVKPSAPYWNLTKHDACVTAMYLVKRFPTDARRLALARELVRFAEDQFVCWERPMHGKWDPRCRMGVWGCESWRCPAVLEQYDCYVPIDASAAKMIRTYLALYRATKNPLDLAKARTLGDAIIRETRDDGYLPTFWFDFREDWPNCMLASAFALSELADLVKVVSCTNVFCSTDVPAAAE